MATREAFMKNGRILMLALDHRGSIEKMLPLSIPASIRRQTIIDIKQTLITSLSPYYSGVLLDSDYGLPAYKKVMESPTPISAPYLLCIEKTGYTDTHHERLTQLEYTVEALKAKGASGVKILLFFHPDARTADQQIALTKKVYEDCKKNGLPFFLEILNYSLDGNPYDASALVPRSVKIFLEHGITADVFKLEFPGSAAACQEVTRMLGETPWILLTKGDTYEGFVAGLKVAIANGSRGFLAGRSIWQDFAQLPQEQWKQFFATIAVERFKKICDIALANSETVC